MSNIQPTVTPDLKVVVPNEFKPGDELKLVYTKDDLGDEDLGMSGIVLKSPLDEVKYYLNDTFIYWGRIEEYPDRILIYRKSNQKRHFIIFREYLAKEDRND